MKFSFKILGVIVAIAFLFVDYSISLGILLALLALEAIKFSRNNMEERIMNSDNLSSRIVFSHFFAVLLIMAVALAISFFFQQLFNPFGVALTFIAERAYSFITGSATGGRDNE